MAIGRAIVRNPKIFLFDEPLSNLDAALRVQMRLELARLHQELAATMIYVTHDQVEAMTLADKVVVLNGGRVEQVGSPLELYHHPANLFVAGFLGTPKMGFLRGHLSRNQGERCEVALECGARVGLPLCAGELATGSPVTLGIRPEHLNIARPGHAFQGLLRVAADVSERLGSDSFCHVRADSGKCSPCACAAISHRTTAPPWSWASIRRTAICSTATARPSTNDCNRRPEAASGNPPMKLNRQHLPCWRPLSPARPTTPRNCARASSTSASAASTARTRRPTPTP